jgi:hypothetical protein
MSDIAREKQVDAPLVDAATDGATFAQTPAWSEVTRLSDESFRVRLGGSFGPGWLASLCCGLAAQRINIERAHAMRTRNLSWIAEFTAVALPGSADPDSVQYLALATSPISPYAKPMRLDTYALETCYDGTLKLSIEAQDSLGLLGAVLEKLAVLGLYPVEMHIETETSRAADTLWLCTADGGTPSDALRDALERALHGALSLPRA